MARAPNFLFQEPKGLPKKFLRQQPCTVTLLLRPLFLAAWQNSHKFLSWKKPLLIRSPINTANFVGPLVTVLTGFHFNRSLQYRLPQVKCAYYWYILTIPQWGEGLKQPVFCSTACKCKRSETLFDRLNVILNNA